MPDRGTEGSEWIETDSSAAPEVEWEIASFRYRIFNGTTYQYAKPDEPVRFGNGITYRFRYVVVEQHVFGPNETPIRPFRGKQWHVLRALYEAGGELLRGGLRPERLSDFSASTKEAVQDTIDEIRGKIDAALGKGAGRRFLQSMPDGRYKLAPVWQRAPDGTKATIIVGARRREPPEALAEAAERSRKAFEDARYQLRRRRGPLAKVAFREGRRRWPTAQPVDVAAVPFDIPLFIESDDWICPEPVALERVQLRASDGGIETRQLNRFREVTEAVRAYLPVAGKGGRYELNTDAILRIENPPMDRFENRASYRLLEVENGCPPILHFGWGRYFEMQNTGEGRALEVASLATYRGDRPVELSAHHQPVQSAISDPFDLRRRCAIPGVDTLTLVQRQDGPWFGYMTRSDRTGVALSQGVDHVMPAGEFQPASIRTVPLSDDEDFDLWRNIVREYVEEFLGEPEPRGHPDYQGHPRYRAIFDAYNSGEIKPYYLGIGLDPLSLKPEILTVCVWDETAFDEVFRDGIRETPEGLPRWGPEGKGYPFTATDVAAFADPERSLPAGIGCILLAWKHFCERKLLDASAGRA